MLQNTTIFSDEEIIQSLRGESPSKLRQAESFLYEAYQDVKRFYQQTRKLNPDIADTIYHDAMTPLIRKIKDGSYVPVEGTPIKAYFHGIFKIQLRNYFSRKVKKSSEKDIVTVGMKEAFPNDRIRTTIEELTTNLEEIARNILTEISPACRVKIEEVELNQLPPEEAWETFGFKNLNAFRAAYARCRKQLKGLILQKIKG
ncbi:MAG: hypothetical protein AAF587_34660 [Bacteroidota bacterium]